MEVLLAVAVCAIVILAVNTVFFGALRLRNKTAAVFDEAVPLQQAVNFIKRDLAGIQFPSSNTNNPMAGPLQTSATASLANSTDLAGGGQRVCPDLYTASAVVDDSSPYSEIQKVAYFLALPTNGASGRDLIRSVSRNLLPAATEQPVQQWLMGGVDTVTFLYYNGTEWADSWDSTTTSNLPTAIKVQITMAMEDKSRTADTPVEIVVPVVVQGRSNTTSTATGGGQ